MKVMGIFRIEKQSEEIDEFFYMVKNKYEKYANIAIYIGSMKHRVIYDQFHERK